MLSLPLSSFLCSFQMNQGGRGRRDVSSPEKERIVKSYPPLPPSNPTLYRKNCGFQLFSILPSPPSNSLFVSYCGKWRAAVERCYIFLLPEMTLLFSLAFFALFGLCFQMFFPLWEIQAMNPSVSNFVCLGMKPCSYNKSRRKKKR